MKCQFSRFARPFPEADPHFLWLCRTDRAKCTKGTKRSPKGTHAQLGRRFWNWTKRNLKSEIRNCKLDRSNL